MNPTCILPCKELKKKMYAYTYKARRASKARLIRTQIEILIWNLKEKMATSSQVDWSTEIKPLLYTTYSSFNKSNVPNLVDTLVKRYVQKAAKSLLMLKRVFYHILPSLTADHRWQCKSQVILRYSLHPPFYAHCFRKIDHDLCLEW